MKYCPVNRLSIIIEHGQSLRREALHKKVSVERQLRKKSKGNEITPPEYTKILKDNNKFIKAVRSLSILLLRPSD